MRVIVVSDAHLVGLADPNQHKMVRWLEALLEVELDELILLGDIFHHWWGFPGVIATDYVPICAALLRAKASGIQIRFVPGNHDFAAGEFFEKTLGAEISGPIALTLAGHRFYLAHGDEADASRRYQLTRGVLRGPVFAGVMRLLGPVYGMSLLRRLAGSSRDHMGDQQPLLEAQRAWARPHLSAGAQYVVMGHVHSPGTICLEEGTVVHLGDWVSHHTFLLIEDAQVELRQLDTVDAPLGVPLRSAQPG